MNKIKQQFTKDFNDSNDQNLSFDTTQLEPNTVPAKRRFNPLVIVLPAVCTSILLVLAVPFAMAFTRKEETIKTYTRNYSFNQIKIAETNTFKKLNTVVYPSGDKPSSSTISDNERNAYSNFSNLTYHSLVNTSKKDNMSYCVSELYSVLNALSGASSREDLSDRLDSLLGLTRTERTAYFTKMIYANSFADSESTTQLKNAAFFNNRFNYSSDYVDYLTNNYYESYQLSFANDLSKIAEWANKAVNTNGFIDSKFLEANDETELFLLSTLYFKNAWQHKYLSDDNLNDSFYLADGSTVQTTFMTHSYTTYSYYDYGSYISIKDYYYLGNASVTYIIPKDRASNIYELTKNVNIFEENNDNLVVPTGENYYEPFMVNLKTPKFKMKNDVDFETSLKSLGFEDMFDKEYDSFKNAFDDETLVDYNIYLQKVKQRNEIDFNEDGTTITSVTMAGIGAGATSIGMNSIDVNLDQPFIYIIKDVNDEPVLVGHVDNPKA